MKTITAIATLVLCVFFSCKKDSASQTTFIIGQWHWLVQYTDNPGGTSTPASTGINETLFFDASNTYFVTQNGITVNNGTFKQVVVKNAYNQNVQAIYFSNTRIKDSVAYFETHGNDTLNFSTGLMGVYGSGARYYVR